MTDKKQLFLVNDGLEGLRIYTKITLATEENQKQYSFYRSTGRSSKYKDTWFPLADKVPLHIEKPNEVWGYDHNQSYPFEFIKHVDDFTGIKFDLIEYSNEFSQQQSIFENGTSEFYNRFGNLECLCISYLLGGGYWDHQDSISVRDFLNANYSAELETLKKAIQHFDSFKNAHEISENDEKISEKILGRDLDKRYRETCFVPQSDYALRECLINYPTEESVTLAQLWRDPVKQTPSLPPNSQVTVATELEQFLPCADHEINKLGISPYRPITEEKPILQNEIATQLVDQGFFHRAPAPSFSFGLPITATIATSAMAAAAVYAVLKLTSPLLLASLPFCPAGVALCCGLLIAAAGIAAIMVRAAMTTELNNDPPLFKP